MSTLKNKVVHLIGMWNAGYHPAMLENRIYDIYEQIDKYETLIKEYNKIKLDAIEKKNAEELLLKAYFTTPVDESTTCVCGHEGCDVIPIPKYTNGTPKAACNTLPLCDTEWYKLYSNEKSRNNGIIE